MKIHQLAIIVSFMLSFYTTDGQDLSAHRWQDRVLLLLVNDANNPMLANQLEAFQNEQGGLEERKLVIYQVLPGKYRTGLDENGPWQISDRLFHRYFEGSAPFSVLLIGLDGGTKLRREVLLSCEELFTVIDGMPMRRAEMRENRKGG